MTEKERKLALHCLKANSDYHSEICEECIKYPCSHRIQDDVTETIIKELEQESQSKTGHWIWCASSHKCSNCGEYVCFSHKKLLKYCPECGARMSEVSK